MSRHIPVLLNEAIEVLKLKSEMTIVDATLGGGGYGKEIVQKIAPGGMYIGIDRDGEAVARAQRSTWVRGARESGVTVYIVHANFDRMGEVLAELNIKKVDGIVADLGISSDQLEDAERGLSFSMEGPLDMRLDRSETLRAFDIVNTWSEEDLTRLLWEKAEERNASRIARAIIEIRREKPIETTTALAEAVRSVVPRWKTGKKDPATKTFMAIRMAVNRELESLEIFLEQTIAVMQKGARLAVVTFHSGEDALVKKVFRTWARACVCPKEFPVCRCGHVARVIPVTKKPIVPTESETRNNPRARSAKLRVVESSR